VFSEEKSLFRTKDSNDQLLTKLSTRKSDARKTFEDNLKIYGLRQEQLDQEKKNLAELNSGIALLQSDVRSFMQQKQKINAALDRIKDLKAKVETLDAEGSKQKAEMELLAVDLQKAEQEKQQMLHAEKLDALRTSLIDGEPCPLCGSAHHPYVHAFAEELLHKNDGFEKIKTSYQNKKTEWERTDHTHRSNRAVLGTEEQELVQYQQDLEKYGRSIEEWKLKLKIDKIQNEEKVAALLQENKEKLLKVEFCIQYLREEPLMVQLEKEVHTYDAGFAALEQVEAAIKLLYGGNDFEEQYQRREDQMKSLQDKRKLANEQSRIHMREQQVDEQLLQTLESALLIGLAKAGYPDISTARSLMSTEALQKQLVAQQKELSSSFSNASTVLADLEKRVQKEAEGDDEAVDLAQQQEMVKECGAQITTWKTDTDGQRTKLGSDDQKRADIQRAETEKSRLQDAIRPWEMLNKLIGDAKGNTFNTMAQELSLQHLLVLANQRMDKLHSRYRLLVPETVDNDDLRVADAHMGGEVRTVRSLSGGETFVISLALALGLSDLASRDIKIESLFVDEGFGSLDPETLEEAMTTLEELQNESNKMVGIISHVDSLKERIYTQIRLEKSNNGFSTLSIFPEVKAADEQEG
jgi:exonuclease SbcC